MAVNLQDLIKRNDPLLSPPRITVYADEGMGKSTLGSQAPNPIFLRSEDGEGVLDIQMLPIVKDWDTLVQYLGMLCSEDHGFLTLVSDTVDHIEPLIYKEICKRNNWDTIEAPGYGKGYIAAMELWREYLEALNYLRDHKKMIIIQLLHAQAKKFNNPETEVYDRYDIKLDTRASALIKETSDIVFFINKKVSVAQEDLGFNKKRKRAVGTNTRYLYCEQRAASTAKNRYNLPEQIEFDIEGAYWFELAKYIPFLGNMLPKQSESNPEQSTTKE